MNVIVGLVIGRVPSHWFLGGGTLLTGLGNVLYAARKENATYWGYEFAGQILSYGGPGLGKRSVSSLSDNPASHSVILYRTKCFPILTQLIAAASTGFIYVTKVVKPTEVAVASACLHFWSIFGGACGAAFSTLIYTNVGDLDVKLLGDTVDQGFKDDLLRGLRASHWFWAGLCFFG
jgi:hypothetical protein